MTLPKISFIYAYPLDAGRRRLYKGKGLGYYPSVEEIREVLSHWEDTWNKVNTDNSVMLAITNTTKRVPTRALECFVFGGGLNPMSTPFLMPVMARGGKMRTDEKFIDTVTRVIAYICY